MMLVGLGRHVKCFLRSGMVLEGIVEESTDVQVVLRSLNDESLMIIHRPAEDIMLTKVMPIQEPTETVEIKPQPVPEQPVTQIQIKNKLEEALQTDDPELQNLSIEELRQLVHEQDKQMIAQKRKEHFGSAGAAKMTQYSSPYVSMKTAYKPGKIPSWAYGRPPRKEK
jgi:sRNA-binding regulator protein Hfq